MNHVESALDRITGRVRQNSFRLISGGVEISDLASPPFFSHGEGNALFYTLAYCRGRYTRARDPNSIAFASISFSTAPNFTRFSLSVHDAEGTLHIYVPGFDEIDTLEYTLLNASALFSIPAASWHLRPIPAQADFMWSERPGDREAYLAARRLLCLILHRLRYWDRNVASTSPRFVLDPEYSATTFREAPDEATEITDAVLRRRAYAREKSGA